METAEKVTAKSVLDVAKKEIGYLEKRNAANLDDKTKNAGSNNYTKYGRDLVKWIGAPYANGVAWCDMFYDWCVIVACKKVYKDEKAALKKAKELLGGWSAYTPTSAEFYKKMNRWGHEPKVGAQIFFRNSERICHTGIVAAVDGNTVKTIEGNTSGSSGVVPNGGGVSQKSYQKSIPRIAGYGYPAFVKK